LLRLAPVAKALGSGDGNTATSGMPIPAFCACRATVSSSQRSVLLRGWPMTCALVDHFAMVFESSNETKEPPNPMSAQNTSSACRFRSTPFS
jgi:hypothetical protein